MLRLGSCICVGLFLAGLCEAAIVSQAAESVETLTIFVSGNTLSSLKPCGCSEGQLGGFERRAGILRAAPRNTSLVIDTGNFIAKETEQDIIKFNIIVQALSMLDYDVVNLNSNDIQTAQSMGLLDNLPFKAISSQTAPETGINATFQKRFSTKNRDTIVTVAGFDTEKQPIEEISNLFTDKSACGKFNILIIDNCSEEIAERIADTKIVDIVICTMDFDRAVRLFTGISRPLFITVGHLGQYVGKLQARPVDSNEWAISYEAIPIEDTLPKDKSLTELYKSYQKIVKDLDLLGKTKRLDLPDSLEYIGSRSCKLCHDYEYKKWSTKTHAKAYETLEKDGSDSDPECVICHVVGLKYNTGFKSKQQTPQLKDVGCEECHGPGSEHLLTIGKAKTRQPQSKCIDCHTLEQSPKFSENEPLYQEKIIHWKEQKPDPNVKKTGGSVRIEKNDKKD